MVIPALARFVVVRVRNNLVGRRMLRGSSRRSRWSRLCLEPVSQRESARGEIAEQREMMKKTHDIDTTVPEPLRQLLLRLHSSLSAQEPPEIAPNKMTGIAPPPDNSLPLEPTYSSLMSLTEQLSIKIDVDWEFDRIEEERRPEYVGGRGDFDEEDRGFHRFVEGRVRL